MFPMYGSDLDGLRLCEDCRDQLTTGRFCRMCAEQRAIDNGADVPDVLIDNSALKEWADAELHWQDDPAAPDGWYDDDDDDENLPSAGRI